MNIIQLFKIENNKVINLVKDDKRYVMYEDKEFDNKIDCENYLKDIWKDIVNRMSEYKIVGKFTHIILKHKKGIYYKFKR